MIPPSSLLVAVLLSLAAPSRAIELSLEENRAERGNIGYIDMTRLFRQFPETLRAKENFEEIVRQTEDQINLRKVEVLKLRGELSQLRMEREILSKSAQIEVPKEAAKPAPKGAKAAEPPKASPKPQTPAEADLEALRASEQGAKPGLTAQDLAQLPGFEGQKVPEQKPADTLVINIPGVSTSSVVVEPPAAPGSDGPPAATDGPPAQVPGQAQAPAQSAAPAPEAAAPAAPAAPSAGTTPAAGGNAALAELDARIALKTNELSAKEAEFKRYQAEQEKNLLDLESRKTEVLLGKIHRAVQEVARREGVSVVVDKNSILYGHDAVDLTEKVLKFLRGT